MSVKTPRLAWSTGPLTNALLAAAGRPSATVLRTATLVIVMALAVAGCGSDSANGATPSAASEPGATLSVIATTTQIADFARNIGGNRVAVTQILQANVDPHDYEPTPADIVAVGKATLILRNGVGLDEWLEDSAAAAGFSGKVVDVSQGITIYEGEQDPDHPDQTGDPHIWQSPRNAKTMTATIEAALAEADASNATYYQANLATYQAKLDKLDADIEAKINTVPVGQRKLVTNHDAFHYYLERYRLELVGSIIPSFDTAAELSVADIDELVGKIKATGVKAVFSETSLPAKTAETIASQAGVTVVAGESSLYADTLGPPGSKGATYLDALTHNTDVIVAALR